MKPAMRSNMKPAIDLTKPLSRRDGARTWRGGGVRSLPPEWTGVVTRSQTGDFSDGCFDASAPTYDRGHDDLQSVSGDAAILHPCRFEVPRSFWPLPDKLTPVYSVDACGSVRALSKVFRRLFLAGLQAACARGELGSSLADPAPFAQLLRGLRQYPFVVYAKPPFGGRNACSLVYLAHNTHRTAIDNSRLVDVTGTEVAFRESRSDGCDVNRQAEHAGDRGEGTHALQARTTPPPSSLAKGDDLYISETKNSGFLISYHTSEKEFQMDSFAGQRS